MEQQDLYDAVIVGGGPAGLTAALYLARARYRVIVVEKERFGGQIAITSEVVNYPGVKKTSGAQLTETMRAQAESFGAEFLMAEATALDVEGDIKTVRTSRGDLRCFGILVATGAAPRAAGFAGEEEFRGRGVAYCATCDGEFFTGKEVFVVGGGFAAAEEAVFLTKYASHVTILVRGEDFSCAPGAAEAARAHERISVITNAQVEAVEGDTALTCLRWRDRVSGEVSEHRSAPGDTFGVFVFAGYNPATELLRGVADLDERGYALTDSCQRTNVPGLFAAGDVCVKSLRQVVTATGDAALAATELERYAAAMEEKTGLVPDRSRMAASHAASTSADAGDAAAQKAPASADALFTPEMRAQLDTVFSRMAAPLTFELHLDARPVSSELRAYIEELTALTDKLSVAAVHEGVVSDEAPCVRVCRADGEWTGLAFHGVPGGHEFTSFVLGLYNAAGPGQPIADEDRAAIAAIDAPVRMQVLVSLSCTMCPDLVVACQRIAADNPAVTAEVYDIAHFPALKDAYNVMSVPCLVIDDGRTVSFGKKTLSQVLDLVSA